MARFDGIITEDVSKTLVPGLTVYDNTGKKVGRVDYVDHGTGYLAVGTNLFSDKDLYIPFHLITNADSREVYLSVSKDELQQTYANPPVRTSTVHNEGDGETMVTTEPSGYDGAPVVVERVNLDRIREQVATGDVVYTADMQDIGTITEYDPTTGWLLVKRGPDARRDLMIPLTAVAKVNGLSQQVHLAMSHADLQKMQHVEPADVVFVRSVSDKS